MNKIDKIILEVNKKKERFSFSLICQDLGEEEKQEQPINDVDEQSLQSSDLEENDIECKWVIKNREVRTIKQKISNRKNLLFPAIVNVG